MADWGSTIADLLVGIAFLGLAGVSCFRVGQTVPTCTRGWCQALAKRCCQARHCCGRQCLTEADEDLPPISQRELEAAGRASGRAARFQIPLMITFGSLLRAVALFINDRNIPAAFDSIQYSIIEVAPEALFASVYLCWIVFVVRAAHCPCPRGCWPGCLLLAPLTERIVPLIITLTAVFAGGIAASTGDVKDAFQHFRQAVQLAFFLVYAVSTVLLVIVGWTTCASIDHFLQESRTQYNDRGRLHMLVRAKDMMTGSSTRSGAARISGGDSNSNSSRSARMMALPGTSSTGWPASGQGSVALSGAALLASKPGLDALNQSTDGRPVVRGIKPTASTTSRVTALGLFISGEQLPGIQRSRAFSTGRRRTEQREASSIGGYQFSPSHPDAFERLPATGLRSQRQLSAPGNREVSMQRVRGSKSTTARPDGAGDTLLCLSDDGDSGSDPSERGYHSGLHAARQMEEEAAIAHVGASADSEASSNRLAGSAILSSTAHHHDKAEAAAASVAPLRRPVSFQELSSRDRAAIGHDSGQRMALEVPVGVGLEAAGGLVSSAVSSTQSSLVSGVSSSGDDEDDDDGLTAQVLSGLAVPMPTPEFVNGRWMQSKGGSARRTLRRGAEADELSGAETGPTELQLTSSQRIQLEDTITVMWIMCVGLVVVLSARCVWAGLICFGAFQSVNGIPTWAETSASLYDAIFFLVVEFLPAALVLWLQFTRSPHHHEADAAPDPQQTAHGTPAAMASGRDSDRLITSGTVKRATQYGSLGQSAMAALPDTSSVISGDSSSHAHHTGSQPLQNHRFIAPVALLPGSAVVSSRGQHDGSAVQSITRSELSDGGSFDDDADDEAGEDRARDLLGMDAGTMRGGHDGGEDDLF